MGLLEEARTTDGMTLGEIARELPGRAAIEGDGAVRAFGVQHDSRRAAPGDLFAVRQGDKHDGRAFIADAVSRGAVALLASDGLALENPTVPVIRASDVQGAFAYAAAAVYGHPAFSLDVIGVTGTNGKTTTTHLVRAAIDGALAKPVNLKDLMQVVERYCAKR